MTTTQRRYPAVLHGLYRRGPCGAALALALSTAPLLTACQSPSAPDDPEWVTRSILGGTHLHALTFGHGIWVVVGQQGKLATSTDLRDWTERTTHWTSADDIHNVHFGNGSFVASGSDPSGTGEYIATSSDGVTWTPRTVDTDADRLGPLYYSDRLNRWFVSGRRDNGPVLLSSSDLVQWSPHDAGFGVDPIISITEGNGLLVISGGSEKIGVSKNGISWTVRQLGHSAESINDIDKVRFFDDVFVAIMHPDASTTYRSEDGEAWTPVPTGWPPRDPACTVWDCPNGPGGWVSIAQRDDGVILATGLRGKTMLSRDLGASWMKLSSPVTSHLNCVHSDGRRFVAAGNDGTLVVYE